MNIFYFITGFLMVTIPFFVLTMILSRIIGKKEAATLVIGASIAAGCVALGVKIIVLSGW